jgi:HCOMODA/2-hydroxy-3-carboxy-muconic semialdehyde decarboxylase
MEEINAVITKLVAGNRILAREGVVDGFGHISARHPKDPERYLLSRSRSPELVEGADIMEFMLDGVAIDDKGFQPYAERHIHGSIYEARPDVMAAVHNHSYEVIPFGITKTPLRPVAHVASRIGLNIPVWDIRAKFGDTSLLVTNMEQGHDMAACLGENHVVLMRGHGCAVAADTIEEAVLKSIYLQINARMQMDAMRLGEVTYLSPGEIAFRETSTPETMRLGTERVWEYYTRRAGLAGG